MAKIFPVSAVLAFGVAPRSTRDVSHLLRNGVTHVLDVQESKVPGRLLSGHVHYLHLPTADTREEVPNWIFDRAARFASPVLAVEGSHLFVCCGQGRQRSPAVVYYLLRLEGIPPQTSENLVRGARASISTVYFASAEVALGGRGR